MIAPETMTGWLGIWFWLRFIENKFECEEWIGTGGEIEVLKRN
jgi:hypothetical protein